MLNRSLKPQELWNTFKRHRQGILGLIIIGFFVTIAIFADWIAPFDPTEFGTIQDVMKAPSWENPLGTDDVGRDILSQIIHGARNSLFIGFLAAAFAVLLGTCIGLIAGYFGGTLDVILMRLTDGFLCFPWLATMIILIAIYGPSTFNLIAVIAITSWPGTARMIRSQVLSEKEKPYVEWAKAIGSSKTHIIGRYIIPSVAPLILANGILSASVAILSESALSFLGLGVPTQISWGTILSFALIGGAITRRLWWWILSPGFCIMLVSISLYLVSHTLDETLNPFLRERKAGVK
jgi:peptide/nickel transport system permease protein